MSTPSLYTLSNERRELMRLLESIEDDACTEEAVRGTLDAIDGEIAMKAPSVAACVLDIEFLAKAAKEAAAKMADRAARVQKRADAIRAYLLTHLLALPEDKQKIETPEFTIAVRKNPSSVEVLEGSEKALPPEYLRDPSKVEVIPAQLRALLRVVAAVSACESTPFTDDDGLVATHDELTKALANLKAAGLPAVPQFPDKTKIGDTLKLRREVSDLQALEAQEPKKLTPAKAAKLRSLLATVNELPQLNGCRLLTGFRLEIRQ